MRNHIQGLLRKSNYVYSDKGFDSVEEYLRHEANPSPNHARMLTVSEPNRNNILTSHASVTASSVAQ